MSRTIIDVTEAHFGEQVGPDLIRRVEGASFEELRALQRAVRAFTEDVELAPRSAGQIRPYVPTERQESRVAPHNLYLRPGDFRDMAVVARGFESLKHHLLYCHSLAIDDPLPWLLDPFVLDDSYEAYLGESREKVVNCLQFLSWIRPLIESCAVVLVENGLNLPQPREAVQDTDRLLESVDFSDLPEELAGLLVKNGDLAKQSFLHLANEHLGWSLEATARHPSALDLYLPYRHHEDLLKAAVDESGSAREAARVGELRVLRNLLNVTVPMLGTLEVTDVVAIREGDAAFEQWRKALELGVTRVDALDPLILGLEDESIRVIRQELDEQRRALEAGISRSGFLSQAKRARKDLAIGAIGLALGSAVWPLATKSGAGLLWDYFTGRRDNEGRVSILRHYLLFAPVPD